MNDRINRKQFKTIFLENFKNYKEWNAIETIKTKDCIFFIDETNYKQITIQFIPATKKYLYTIYVNADLETENEFIINYFKNLNLRKNYCLHDTLNNIDYIL